MGKSIGFIYFITEILRWDPKFALPICPTVMAPIFIYLTELFVEVVVIEVVALVVVALVVVVGAGTVTFVVAVTFVVVSVTAGSTMPPPISRP
jgi:hypothetical protein